ALFAQGESVSTTLNGGTEIVSVGGFATLTLARSGGFISVGRFAEAGNPRLSSGGSMNVAGTAVLATLNRGREFVFSGGPDEQAMVSSGGIVRISSGALGEFESVRSSGLIIVLPGGLTSRNFISNGGQEVVSGGASDLQTTILSGGAEVLSGG